MASRRPLVRAQRRTRFWIGSAGAVVKASSSVSIDLFAQYRAALSLGSGNPTGTIAAFRLQFDHNLTTPTVISQVHLGLIIGSLVPSGGQANDPSPEAVPNSNPGADWMMNHRFFVRGVSAAAAETVLSREVVIKAMRRLTDQGQTLYLVMSNTTDQGTFNYHARTLFIRN